MKSPLLLSGLLLPGLLLHQTAARARAEAANGLLNPSFEMKPPPISIPACSGR